MKRHACLASADRSSPGPVGLGVAGRRTTGVDGAVVELWVERRAGRPAVNPVMARVLGLLAEEGAHARAVVPESEWFPRQGARAPDLVLLKSATPLALSRAEVAEQLGGRFLNGAAQTRAAHDKAGVVGALAAAGLPVPETWLGEPPRTGGEWVIKPPIGVHGDGVRICRSAVEGADGQLVQRRVGGDEPDVKVYVASGRAFAGRKAFSASSYASDEIAPVALRPATRELVHAAGDALGLTLFGVDLRLDADGQPWIIDVNPFPGYRGFPAAAAVVAGEALARLVAA